jgi:hypothetical protein
MLRHRRRPGSTEKPGGVFTPTLYIHEGRPHVQQPQDRPATRQIRRAAPGTRGNLQHRLHGHSRPGQPRGRHGSTRTQPHRVTCWPPDPAVGLRIRPTARPPMPESERGGGRGRSEPPPPPTWSVLPISDASLEQVHKIVGDQSTVPSMGCPRLCPMAWTMLGPRKLDFVQQQRFLGQILDELLLDYSNQHPWVII